MAEPYKILELEQKDGKIIELPILADDTPDKLAERMRKNGFDPSPYSEQLSQALGNGDMSDSPQQMRPDPKKVDPLVATEANAAYKFPEGSNQRKRQLETAKALEDILGTEPPKKLTAGIKSEDIASIIEAQNSLKDLLAFKSKGFGGKGIDTGFLMGGGIPLPFSDSELPFVPGNVNEFYNRIMGEGENAADRTELRRKIMSVMNPVREDVTGAAAATSELEKFIFPTLPTESDNDMTFYKKGMGSLKESQKRLLAMLDAIERSGSGDVSGFKDIRSKNPDQLIEELLTQITDGYSLDEKGNLKGTGEYDFGTLMPDTTKEFLKKKKGPISKQATHRYNPETGQIERIE